MWVDSAMVLARTYVVTMQGQWPLHVRVSHCFLCAGHVADASGAYLMHTVHTLFVHRQVLVCILCSALCWEHATGVQIMHVQKRAMPMYIPYDGPYVECMSRAEGGTVSPCICLRCMDVEKMPYA